MGCGFSPSTFPKGFPFSVGIDVTLTGPFQRFQGCILCPFLSLDSPHRPLFHSDDFLLHLRAQRSQLGKGHSTYIKVADLAAADIIAFVISMIPVSKSSLVLSFSHLFKTYLKPCLFYHHLTLAKCSSLSIYPACVVCTTHTAGASLGLLPWEPLWSSGYECGVWSQ